MTAMQLPSACPDENRPYAQGPEREAERARAALPSKADIRKPEEPPAPQHPIPFMQDAFAESLVEATQGGETPKPKLRTGDAKARREELLDQEKLDPPPAALWRYRPGQVNHELRRLMAQISFGVYLLLNGMANSQVLVVSILQGHIDEVDEFLEATLEDIGLATKDLRDRITHLKLPMDNMEVFESMLEDSNFRMQILEGNQKIEHIVARTQIALQQTVQDLAEGVSATREFSLYLAEQEHGNWRQDRPDVIDIFDAMKGNTDGWFNAFIDLQAKSSTLNGMIVRLNGMVSEMERKAGEASRRTDFSVELHASPGSSPTHSPRGSDASWTMVPPASPLPKISSSPPRLSLRLSSITKLQSPDPSSYFDIKTGRESVNVVSLEQTLEQDAPAQEIKSKATEEMREEKAETLLPRSPPARNPRRLSERPPMRQDSPSTEKDEEGNGALYTLQPRTYTPQPPSPLPSPSIRDRPSQTTNEQPKARVESMKPRVDSGPMAVKVLSLHREPLSPRLDQTRQREPLSPRLEQVRQMGPLSPRFEQAQLRRQPSKPKLVAIGARADSKSVRRPVTQTEAKPEVIPELKPEFKPEFNPETAPELASDSELQPRQRTSLRQRVSLKTTPPESIQVPPPSVVEQQRPLYHHSPRGYQAPDSAYGSDMERPPVNSMVSINTSSIPDFPIPGARPVMVPSPRSDQQFFRPIQPSPHSPLQQRPHTSGNVSSRSQSNQAPSRHIPSAMGMSTLSNVTTMTHETGSTRTLKKKRSAFGWLKKAFSLDEEERAAFEQRKRDQARNLYYDGKSPKFLDGKRIQPPRQQTPAQAYYAGP